MSFMSVFSVLNWFLSASLICSGYGKLIQGQLKVWAQVTKVLSKSVKRQCIPEEQ